MGAHEILQAEESSMRHFGRHGRRSRPGFHPRVVGGQDTAEALDIGAMSNEELDEIANENADLAVASKRRAKQIANKYCDETGGPPKARAGDHAMDTRQAFVEQPTGSDSGDESVISELAELSEFAYQKRRADAAKELGIKVAALDKLVREARAQAEDDTSALPH